jgi:hypothetical protein
MVLPPVSYSNAHIEAVDWLVAKHGLRSRCEERGATTTRSSKARPGSLGGFLLSRTYVFVKPHLRTRDIPTEMPITRKYLLGFMVWAKIVAVVGILETVYAKFGV